MSFSTKIKVTDTPVSITTVPAALPWESLTVFEAEYAAAVSAASEGETITMNLTGRYFDSTGIPAPGGVGDERRYGAFVQGGAKNLNLVINGGTFSGTIRPTWVTDGVYQKADIYDTVAGWNPLYDSRLFDPEAPIGLQPRVAVYPRAATGYEQHPLAANSNWLALDIAGLDSIQVDGGSAINGITVGTAATAAQVTIALGTSSLVTGDDEILIHGLTGPNVVYTWTVTSWDESTGVMEFDSAQTYDPGYFRFAFTGRKEFATEPGDCARVLNKTNGHNELFFIPYPTTYMHFLLYPIMETPLWMYSGTTASSTTFNDSIMQGGGQQAILSNSLVELTLNRCLIRWSRSGVASSATKGQLLNITDCYIHDHVNRCVVASDGTTITGSRILDTEKQETVAIYVNFTGRSDGDERLPVVIKHNIFSCPLTNHGTGLTLYGSSWTNSEVSHNIFYNARRSIALQSSGVTSGYSEKSCDIVNNLFITDYIPEVISGQAGISENGRGDGTMWDDLTTDKPNQHINYAFNTAVGDIAQGNLQVHCTASFPSFYYIDVNVVGNVLGAYGPPVGLATGLNTLAPDPPYTDWQGGADRSYTADNYIWYGTGPNEPNGRVNSWSAEDIPALDSMAQYDYANLTPTGALLTAATDSGKIGHRWDDTNPLTLAAVQAKVAATSGGSDIETYWPALATPDAPTYTPTALAVSLVYPP